MNAPPQPELAAGGVPVAAPSPVPAGGEGIPNGAGGGQLDYARIARVAGKLRDLVAQREEDEDEYVEAQEKLRVMLVGLGQIDRRIAELQAELEEAVR